MATITIQPQVFKWLCRSSGWTPDEISARIAEPVDLVQKWCEGTESVNLTINNLEKLSDSFKRPLTAFLLPSPPENEIVPNDFRKLPDAKGDFSKETLRMMRKAQWNLGLWRELSENINESAFVNLPRYSLQDNPEKVARMERERLHLQKKSLWSNEYGAYRFWRELLSSMHILVLQLKMPIDEARGFAIVEDGYAAVVVNGRDTPHARIFTLFHEYAHLLLGEIVICNNQSEHSSNPFIRGVETWCNNFAGAFLIPEEEIKNHKKIQKCLQKADYVTTATVMSTYFRVSKDAALIRLRVLNLISEKEIEHSRNIIQGIAANSKMDSSYQKVGESEALSDKKIVKNPVIQCLSEKGIPFVSLVLKNETAGKITYLDVTDYLDLKSKQVDKLKQRGICD